MVFTSFSFLLFLICVVTVYFLCPVKFRWIVLLLASGVFYCLANVIFLPFIIITAAISYFVARLIHKQNEKCVAQIAELDGEDAKEKAKILKGKCKSKCRALVTFAIVLIIGYLGVTKFGKQFLTWMSTMLGSGPALSAITIIVPLGISYYSFSTVGYMLDVYWKRYAPEKNFFKYLLYVMYFPHILQGPIARYDRLGVQFSREHRFDYKRVCFGAQLILWGFFQKLVIADRINVFVTAIYDKSGYDGQYGSVLLFATLLYAIQIYTDFAGCVNIARGVSQIFGIEIEDNFRQPYFAKSVDEFWRRWHMTLGAWFKDYVCIPVSVAKPVKNTAKFIRKRFGSGAGKNVTTIAALIVVWICTGVWHGTGANYILWAVWQGGIIVLSLMLEPVYGRAKKVLHINDDWAAWKGFQMLRTFILTGIIPRVIVRAAWVGGAFTIFKQIFTDFHVEALFDGTLLNCGLNGVNFWILFVAVIILIATSVMKEMDISIRESISKMPIVFRWLIYIFAFYSVVIFGIYGPGYDASAFAYMGF